MGAGASASSSSRLRKALILRAYNIRGDDETLEDQFRKYAFKKDGAWMLSLQDVKDVLAMNAPYVDELFRKCLGESTAEVELGCFIEFLETGKMNFAVEANPSFSRSKRMDFNNLSQPPGLNSRPVEPGAPGSARGGMPPTPPRAPLSTTSPRRSGGPQEYVSPRSMYSEVFSCLGFKKSHIVRKWNSSSTTYVAQDNRGIKHMVSRGLSGCFDQAPEDSGSSGEMRIPAPGKPLWRKREVVRSERTVHYTTVDASGLLQELVEKECTETEVLHMECRETGEFAHRETTKYEQQETFNNEVVAEEKGTEEYVHLKSLEDEIEYMESNMPRRGRGGQEDAPPQGEARTEYEVHEAEDADIFPGAPESNITDEGMWHNDLPKWTDEGDYAAERDEKGSPNERTSSVKQNYGDWGSATGSLPHVHVHIPFDDQVPESMLGATFEGFQPSPPAYSAELPHSSTSPKEFSGHIEEACLPAEAAVFGIPSGAHMHVHPFVPSASYFAASDPHDSETKQKENEENGTRKQRRKWPCGAKGEDLRASRQSGAWYNDSEAEDATDRADDSGVSAPQSGDAVAVDKNYLFAAAPAVGETKTSEGRKSGKKAPAVSANPHADNLLRRYDSFEVD